MNTTPPADLLPHTVSHTVSHTKMGRGGEGVLEGEPTIGEPSKPAQDTVYVPKDYLRQVEQDNAEWERAWQRREWRENALAWALFVVSLMLGVVAWLATWNVVH